MTDLIPPRSPPCSNKTAWGQRTEEVAPVETRSERESSEPVPPPQVCERNRVLSKGEWRESAGGIDAHWDKDEARRHRRPRLVIDHLAVSSSRRHHRHLSHLAVPSSSSASSSPSQHFTVSCSSHHHRPVLLTPHLTIIPVPVPLPQGVYFREGRFVHPAFATITYLSAEVSHHHHCHLIDHLISPHLSRLYGGN